MKKTILALGVSTLLAGLATTASAQSPLTSPLVVTPTNIGHILVVPYFTAQEGNATLLNIVNTDKVNGKALKVRFRGASNSDDVFDFTLFLSPGDVWAAEISQNPSTGLARLSTSDNSCTLPTQVNRDFITARVNPKADTANETREGYIEILNAADIVPGTAVYSAIKHVKGAPPVACSNGARTPDALRPLLTEAGIASAGFSAPTTGLFADWSIFNVAEATSWSGVATAVTVNPIFALDSEFTTQVVLHPQANGTPTGPVDLLTADPLFQLYATSGGTAGLQLQHFDLPDLSTPYLAGGMFPAAAQALFLSLGLAKTSIKNEYFTDDRVQAQTDWVFSSPTRRYHVALDYTATTPASQVVFNQLLQEEGGFFYNTSNITVEGSDATRKICVSGIERTFWDRSEQYKESDDDFVISPSPIAPKVNLCGEVAVWSINAGDEYAPSALAANVTRKNIEVGYADGWGEFLTPGLLVSGPFPSGLGLPMLGAAFAKATSTNVGAGVLGNFGLVWEHKYTVPEYYNVFNSKAAGK